MEKNKKWKLSIEMSTIIVAVIAFLGTFLGTILQGYFSQMEQKEEFESTLVIKAVETGNTQLSKNNLKFLVDAGLITEKNKVLAIKKIIKDSTYIITRGVHANDGVFICTNPNSKKYHYVNDCKGLSNCTDNVIKVNLKEAKNKYHRELCGYED